MDKSNEDDLLIPLFSKIPLNQVRPGFTQRVMDEILRDPVIETVENEQLSNWWWVPVGALVILASYFSGVFQDGFYQMVPYFSDAFLPVSGYLHGLYQLLMSWVVLLYESIVFPAIVAGVTIILAGDAVLGKRLKRA